MKKYLLFTILMLVSLMSGCQSNEQQESIVPETPKEVKQASNRLIHEKSPYLLQHADNPVDWYPWGDEAFEKAKKEDKPIFLSIGYSTCHWCHVMEHESFEDPIVSSKINEYFIPIKVDREERPDIDNIYMSAVMAMTGRGGWPLTVVLTHDKKPFFGGTYFPPYAKWGSPGLMDVMESIHNTWTNNREKVFETSSQLTDMLIQRATNDAQAGPLSPDVLQNSFRQLNSSYDSAYGGFGSSPKFPTSHNLSLLLRHWKRASEPKALEIVEKTLKAMAAGGMYDHIGGGFHRYATDRQWQIPHFEKMLYDQAILSRTYLEAYQITKNEFYADITREVFDYVLRDLHHAKGGFYSAEDADSLDPDEFKNITPDPNQSHEKKEGSFYLWREAEIDELLDKVDTQVFKYHFGIKPDGNAHSDPHGEFIGKNIVFVEHNIDATATKFGKTREEIVTSLGRSKKILFDVRNQRPHSHLDDKVLVDWNGLMIASLAFGAKVLDEPKYLEAAQKATDFIIDNLVTNDGRLLHRYRDGESAIMGTIEDYAFFIHGLIELYEATFKIKYLDLARQLSDGMIELFWDEENGGFFFTADDAEKLLYRQKEIYDGAIPSGNSFAALNLVRLYHITLDAKWNKNLEQLFKTFSSDLSARPSAYAQMMIAFDYALGPSQEIVLSGAKNNDTLLQMHKSIYDYFIPNRIILHRPDSDHKVKELLSISPFVENQRALNAKATAYVCENHVCKLPVQDVAALQEILKGLSN